MPACQPLLGDVALAALAAHAHGCRVAVTGWAHERIARAVLVALDHGASGVRGTGGGGADFARQRLLEAAAPLGLSERAQGFLDSHHGAPSRHFDSDPHAAWWIEAALDHPDLRNRLDAPETLLDIGALFHERDPPRRIAALAALQPRWLIIDTIIVEPEAMPADSGFGTDAAWCAPAMTAAQTAAMAAYWQAHDVQVEQFRRLPQGGTMQDFVQRGGGSPWWWFLSPGAVAAMLAAQGYRVTEQREAWGGRSAVFVATPAP